jgi:hypothetical protein
MPAISAVVCPHCGALNHVAHCVTCARPFVLTVAHAEGRRREYQDKPLQHVPHSLTTVQCDFCATQKAGNPFEAVKAGLRQNTCPVCHTEFL